MMSIFYVFWMYVILFGVIGALRGWVKELIVACSVITALAANAILRHYFPPVVAMDSKSTELFWTYTVVLVALTFFGYQTVGIVPHLAPKARRESLVEAFLGLVVGAINGYLIAGTILFYMDQAAYPLKGIVDPPSANFAPAVQSLMTFMPPRWLGIPWVFIAPILCLIFILVVYI
jgi:uncharacterized membrane protein required for colicin V production